MNEKQWLFRSKLGPLYLVASKKGLKTIAWDKQPVPSASSLRDQSPEVRVLSLAVRQLSEYIVGKRRTFSIPMDVPGTRFQKNVWNALKQIPYGKTHSYRDIARKIRHPKAVRAVGNANGRNPLPIIVPCHRVIAADGSIGGYSGGLAMKSQLLKIERIKF